MKKRLLSLVLCLVMVFSLLPMGTLAVDRYEEGYEAYTTETWTVGAIPAEVTDENNVYALIGNEYVKVNLVRGNIYSVITNSNGSAKTSWTAQQARDTYAANTSRTDQNIYYMNGSTPEVVYVSREPYYKHAGNKIPATDLDRYRTWGYTTNGEMQHTYYYNTVTDSSAYPDWRQVYMNYRGVTADGYYYYLWYYTDKATESIESVSIFDNEEGYNLLGRWHDGNWGRQFNKAYTDGKVAFIPASYTDGPSSYGTPTDANYHAYCKEYGTFTSGHEYTGGKLYTQQSNNSKFNYMYTDTTVLAWPQTKAANDSSSTVPDSTTYSGPLYYHEINGLTNITLADGSAFTPSNERHIQGETVYTGKLYYHTMDKVVDPAPTTEIITTTTEEGKDGIYVDKTLTEVAEDSYSIELDAYTTGNTTAVKTETKTPKVDPMDIVLVIDQSASMATADMGNAYGPAQTPEGGWTVEKATGGKQYYAYDGTDYYPVQAETGNLYEPVTGDGVTASDLLGWGDDSISLGVNGAPTHYNVKTDYYVRYNGELHRVFLITAGLFGSYGLYPYIYTSNSDSYVTKDQWIGHNYWVAIFDPWDGSDLRDNSTWNTLTNGGSDASRVSFLRADGTAIGSTDSDADSIRQSYHWFRDSSEDEWLGSRKGVKMTNLYRIADVKAGNQLYYVDNSGVKHNIGSKAYLEGDVVYTGTLYEGTGTTRVEALKASVNEFLGAVEDSAKTYGVDHRVAIVGFAGNRVPTNLGGTTAYGTTQYDFTNSGLFVDNGFKNYNTIGSLSATNELFINRHYYNSGAVSNGVPSGQPIVYQNSNWKNLITGSNYYGTFYKPNYTALSDTDYSNALISINNAGQIDSELTNAVNQFSANGYTYTSYGMTMAENILAQASTAGVDSEGHDTTRQRYVIVFTDGEPGASVYDSAVAGEALVSGNKAKTEQNATVFTVGLFKTAASSQVTDFMKKLSSEYEAELTPVYGGAQNDNNSLGSLSASKTYFYVGDDGKYYALNTDRSGISSLGWWIYNDSHTGNTTSFSLTTPKSSTGAGATRFYKTQADAASGSIDRSVKADDVNTNTVYYTSDGDQIVYEYRWYDSNRSVILPKTSASDEGSLGVDHVQFYEMTGATANADGESYYMTASNADELNVIFQNIAGTLIEEEVVVQSGTQYTDDTVYLMDEITGAFDVDNAQVKVYADPVATWKEETVENEDGSTTTVNVPDTFTVDDNANELNVVASASDIHGVNDVVVTWTGKQVKVLYYDWGRNYCLQGNDSAKRLRVVITGLKPNSVGTYYSNTAQSGIYYTDGTDTKLLEAFPRPQATIPGHNVTWYSEDGSQVYDSAEALLYGTTPVYNGEEPTKETFEDNSHRITYTFDGWSTVKGGDVVVAPGASFPTLHEGEHSAANENIAYYAHFSASTSNFYTATWFDGETELYQQIKLANGDVPEYAGVMPTKAADDEYDYFFAGWYDEAAHQRNGDNYVAADVITQLPAINGANVVYYAVFASMKIDTEVYVMEYGTKNVIREEGVYSFEAISTPGGEFGQEKADGAETGSFFFIPSLSGNAQFGTDKNVKDMTGFSKVNTGAFYEGPNSTRPTKVNVIPGSSVYFDDSLQTVSANVKDATADTKTFDYEAALKDSDAKVNVNKVDSYDKGEVITFKFTGSRIDLYCTTNGDASRVNAVLVDNTDGDKRIASKIMGNTFVSGETLYNVPTLSFVTPDASHTYTLTVTAMTGGYRFDGVRVYGPMAGSEDSAAANAYADVKEQGTEFFKVRDMLISAKDFGSSDDVSGAVFVDKNKGPATDVSDYVDYGPKNEVYLASNQLIAFQLDTSDYDADTLKVQIGLSAPAGKGGSVMVSYGANKVIEKSSLGVTDIYYDITPAAGGKMNVVVKNTGNQLIAVTNIKISGVKVADQDPVEEPTEEPAGAPQMRMFAMNRSSLMSYVESFDTLETVEPEPLPTNTPEPSPEVEPSPTVEPTAEPTVEPTSTPSIQDLVRQFISNFVSNLFRSIANLFGN